MSTRAQQIARKYNHGKLEKNGSGGWIFCCPIHGDKDPSGSIWDTGDDDVRVHCHVGCNYKEIKDYFIQAGDLPSWKPCDDSKYTTPLPTPKPKESIDKKPDKRSFIWDKATKSAEDLGHISKYLSNRSIILDPLPPCLRWYKYQGEYMIVVAASKPGDKEVYAVNRLYIDIDTHTKTPNKSGKKEQMYGTPDCRGCWFDRKGDLSTVLIGEGLETTLSAMQATGKKGCAALSAGGMKSLIIPEETEAIYILVDSDPIKKTVKASMTGQKAAVHLAKRFEKERKGGTAYLVSPDDTCFSDNPTYLDFNDLLQADPTGESIRERMSKAISFKDLGWSPPVDDKKEDNENSNNHDAEQAMFDRFIFLASENKIIDTIGHDIKEATMVERAFIISQAGEYHFFTGEDGKQKSMPLTKHWLSSDGKKVAAATRYKPGEELFFRNGDGRNYYNTFRLPYEKSPSLPEQEVQDRLRPWGILMDAVFHEHRPYIEDWLAFSLQQPGKRAGIMPVCISRVGLGKSLLMAIVSLVVGHQNFSNGKILDVTGLGKTGTQWGDWIYNKKISCIEEISPEGESSIQYKVLDALKDIITNETLSLNLKHGRNGTFPVFSNIIGFSNHIDCIKVPFGDRRLFIVDSMGQELLPQKQYNEIFSWKEDEQNIIAVYQYLVAHEISSDFVPGQAMMTDAKRMLQIDGRSTMQTAFDMIVKQSPCDLMTPKEISNAVNCAMIIIDDEYQPVDSLNASKQYQAIYRASTKSVANGERVRVQREGGKQTRAYIKAIRNEHEWIKASKQEIKEAMTIGLQDDWLGRATEDPLMF